MGKSKNSVFFSILKILLFCSFGFKGRLRCGIIRKPVTGDFPVGPEGIPTGDGYAKIPHLNPVRIIIFTAHSINPDKLYSRKNLHKKKTGQIDRPLLVYSFVKYYSTIIFLVTEVSPAFTV